MKHVIRYEGGFERNFPKLHAGTDAYEGDDGRQTPIEAWPVEADGVRFGYMEQHGKRFVAVRVLYGGQEVILQHPVPLDRDRHLGGKRFSPDPIMLGDAAASALLGDILDANAEQREELTALRDNVRRTLGPRAATQSPRHAAP